MSSCYPVEEFYNLFSGVKLSIRSSFAITIILFPAMFADNLFPVYTFSYKKLLYKRLVLGQSNG